MFAIDIAAFALMSNHYHLVVRVDTAKASGWSYQDIADRRQLLFRLPVLVERYLSADSSGAAENQVTETIIENWRTRLCDISWFMRCLNEQALCCRGARPEKYFAPVCRQAAAVTEWQLILARWVQP